MKNQYEVRGEVTAIKIFSPKYGKMETLISTSKLERVKELSGSWYVKTHPANKNFYVYGNKQTANGKREQTKLHRWITNAPDGMVVDHFNHDTLDHTDSNLRVITHAENSQNRKGASKNSKSGIRGVSWYPKLNKWHAQLFVNGKRIYIGYFLSSEEAESAVMKARAKYMPYSQEALSS